MKNYRPTDADLEYIRSLPEDNYKALEKLSLDANGASQSQLKDSYEDLHRRLFRSTLFIELFCQTHGISLQTIVRYPKNLGEMQTVHSMLLAEINEIVSKNETHQIHEQLKQAFEEAKLKKDAGNYHFEFTDTDVAEIKKNIDVVRNSISQSEELSPTHKYRLLRSLDIVDTELNNRTNSLDKLNNFFGELVLQSRIFGDKIKPVIEASKPIIDIAAKVARLAYNIYEIAHGSTPNQLGI